MLQAILSRVHYNLMHPKTPMAIMPLVEEQIRRQRSKAAVPQQEWQMTERLKCQPDPPDLLLTIVQGLEQFAHDYEHHCEIARSRGLQPISSKRACEALRKIEEAIERL
ncbi:MAG: hypothetical protein DMG41_14115 [Acidobacteria bacterium]|nr:MAG: hypothetical protein AUH13_04750 [Acidobacteria bacterium 13_2_20CM_58_27]PYT87910.1 MAG: hypothetical protein DMG41_14115 [Acidobacteriota bacterium]